MKLSNKEKSFITYGKYTDYNGKESEHLIVSYYNYNGDFKTELLDSDKAEVLFKKSKLKTYYET